MRLHRNTARRAASTLAACAALLLVVPSASADTDANSDKGTPGSAGLGDPLFPLSGNGGYRVSHTRLDLDWQAPKTAFPAVATIEAVATQSLSRFDLDFAGNTLGRVLVDGKPAQAVRDGDELVVTPGHTLRKGRSFKVRVEYTADPTLMRHRDDAIEDYGWIPTPDGTVVYPQPNGTQLLFPSNDHPSVRFPVTVSVTAPDDVQAVAAGRLTGRDRAGAGRTRWTYESRDPVAGQLVQFAVGHYEVLTSRGPDGVTIRDAVPPDLVARTAEFRALTAEHLRWLSERLGPYPFSTYGLLVAHTDLGVALESQTLSLIPEGDLTGDRVSAERNMVHELTHQWFGDSVALAQWSDLWLSEGHARYYERLYSESHGGDGFEAKMKDAYRQHDLWRRDYGPPAAPTEPNLFKRMRYDGSALVLYALRAEVGDTDFGRIERAWVALNRGRAASTLDYIHLASAVAGRDLGPFLHAWLYDAKTPPMPGHPDWVVDPVPPATP
ncbi:M1 family metallopeptidase [Yinghuangia seranimata]|uniref:M1 family metallopeptidase n=1 Tax=Yinghuangia seranimata TaxID=408067 RepID=UPI00248BC0DD|nr:M1 family metallopeptidase [Yinghuangia seranimata]MDI2132061.1 M1 family metallopeptidase [Yinghuangia seranimata]